MDFSFDQIDLSTLQIKSVNNDNKNLQYDNTTNETYRIKRLFKIDPLIDQEIPNNLLFEFKYRWNPYNGEREQEDEIGSLCFNALNLYDYYYSNRFKGLWNPPIDQYQGYYGDLLGTGKNIKIVSRGENPEKYLYRLPIIDCYLKQNHNYSIVTMGPVLNDEEINQIDKIILTHHKNRFNKNFIKLSTLKLYYDNAIESCPDQNSNDIVELVQKYPNLTNKEINDKFNRYYVDKLLK